MNPIDGTTTNLLTYYKENKIPHTYQCSICGDWMGDNKTQHIHNWVIRDLRPFQKDGIQNAISHRDDSV